MPKIHKLLLSKLHFLNRRLIRIGLVVLNVVVISTVTNLIFNFVNNHTTAKALTSYTSCYSYTDNKRIRCIAASSELYGMRYANSSAKTKWLDYWKKNGYSNQSSINSSFGNSCRGGSPSSSCPWFQNSENLNSATNFMDCSGFVNVVMYLALKKNNSAGGSSGTYINTGKYSKISIPQTDKNFGFSELLRLAQPGDLLIYDGHVAIYSSASSDGSKYMVQEQAGWTGANSDTKPGSPNKSHSNYRNKSGLSANPSYVLPLYILRYQSRMP